ncbi:MAG: hypothetical protein KOO60_10855 [Gemmatimonadales bacterium]|nr:hypothetical protein [Gemmatimonadales bacterium]
MLKPSEVEAIQAKPSRVPAATVRCLAYEWLEMWQMMTCVLTEHARREGEARGARRMLALRLGIGEEGE